MKIKEVNVFVEDLSLTKAYEVAYQINDEAINAFVEIVLENGIVGLGAASPSKVVINQTIEDIVQHLNSDTVKKLVGRDIRHFRQLISEIRSEFPKQSATCTALDIALHDAFGKFINIPVVQFYGQKIKGLPTSVTIGINNVTETLKEAEEYLEMGFSHLKLKTGKSVEEDVERCIKLREVYKDKIKIRVDANQGYSLKDTIAFYEAVKELDLELIEQPMPEGEEEEMRKLPDFIKRQIACDESLKSARGAFSLATKPQVCGIFNIKMMKCGGLLGAFEIAEIAKVANIELFWGCFDESIVSISAALHSALACENTKYLDLDGSLFLGKDMVTEGFILEKGFMRPNGKSGFGFEYQRS